MRRIKFIAGGLLLAFLAGALLWWAQSLFVRPIPASAAPALKRVLSLSLPDAQGRVQPLAQWQGRALLINFWASWCGPCREEMPLLEAMARQQGPDGVQIIGIAIDNAANVQEYLRHNPAQYPVLIANEQIRALLPALGNPVQGLPFSLLSAGDGQLASIRLGAFQPAELAHLLHTVSVPNGSNMK